MLETNKTWILNNFADKIKIRYEAFNHQRNATSRASKHLKSLVFAVCKTAFFINNLILWFCLLNNQQLLIIINLVFFLNLYKNIHRLSDFLRPFVRKPCEQFCIFSSILSIYLSKKLDLKISYNFLQTQHNVENLSETRDFYKKNFS